jgi:hypothetical protein
VEGVRFPGWFHRSSFPLSARASGGQHGRGHSTPNFRRAVQLLEPMPPDLEGGGRCQGRADSPGRQRTPGPGSRDKMTS